MMDVSAVNDGPVTILLEAKRRYNPASFHSRCGPFALFDPCITRNIPREEGFHMHIQSFVISPIGSNCYVLAESPEAGRARYSLIRG